MKSQRLYQSKKDRVNSHMADLFISTLIVVLALFSETFATQIRSPINSFDITSNSIDRVPNDLANDVNAPASCSSNGLTDTICTLDPAWASGSRLVITSPMIDGLMNDKLLPELIQSVMGLSVPDMEGTATTSTGKVEYLISDILVTECGLLQSEFIVDSVETVFRENIHLQMGIEFNYEYEKLAPPYMRDEGIGRISVEDLDITLNIETHHDEYGAIGFSVFSIPTHIEGFDIHLDSPLSWLYDLIFSIVEDSLVETLEKNIESVAMDYAASIIAQFQKKVHLCFQFGSSVSNDIRVLTNGFEIGDGYLWMGYSFATAVVPSGECNCTNFENAPQMEQALPNIVTNDMWQFIMSQMVIKELYDNYCLAGYFNDTFNPMTTPSYSEMFTGSYWISLFPDLAGSVSPTDSLSLSISATNNVEFDIYPATCLIEIPVHAVLSVLPNNNVVLEMDLKVSFTLDPVEPESNTPHLKFYSECDDVIISEISIDPASYNSLYLALLDIQEKLIHPSFKETFLLDSFNIISLTGVFPDVYSQNGRFALGTDHGGYIAWTTDLVWD